VHKNWNSQPDNAKLIFADGDRRFTNEIEEMFATTGSVSKKELKASQQTDSKSKGTVNSASGKVTTKTVKSEGSKVSVGGYVNGRMFESLQSLAAYFATLGDDVTRGGQEKQTLNTTSIQIHRGERKKKQAKVVICELCKKKFKAVLDMQAHFAAVHHSHLDVI